MENIYHIKAGGVSNGLPEKFNGLLLTETYREGENFKPVNGQMNRQLKVQLPWVFHPNKNLKVSLMSFVIVNGIYKYRAEKDGDDIYLHPIQPYFKHLEDLPVIKLDSGWENALNFEMRAIAYFFVEGNLCDFKTSSKFTIENFRNELDKLEGVPSDILAQLDVTLNYKTKLFKVKKSDEVSYVSMQPISPRDIAMKEGKDIKVVKALRTIEKAAIQKEEDAIKNALNVEDARKFFGNEFVVTLDTVENESFDTDIYSKVKAAELIKEKRDEAKKKEEESEEEISNLTDILNEILEKGLEMPLAKALVKKHKENALKVFEDAEGDISILVKSLY